MARFRYQEFDLGSPSDVDRYEALMQDLMVDKSGAFEIVDKGGHWTKEGDHIVFVSYLEKDVGPERW